MTIKEAYESGVKSLKKRNVEGPETSIDFLLRKTLNVDKKYLILKSEKKISPEEERKFLQFVERRANHEPLWYITGEIEFFDQVFFVTKDVLIPRPETELLIEKIIEDCNLNGHYQFLDVGTGSGAIGITLAKMFQTSTVSASDISGKAVEVAKKNAMRNDAKVTFKTGDLLTPWRGHKFDIIVANLPYIPHEEMSTLAPDIINYEPQVALDGGNAGIDVYKRMIRQLPTIINKGGVVYLEIGDKQGDLLSNEFYIIFPEAKIEILKDYSSYERIFKAETYSGEVK